MDTRTCRDWHDFHDVIRELRTTRGREMLSDVVMPIEILYRGQADSTWELSTTLEREGYGGWSVLEYTELTYSVAPKIEIFAGRKWDMPPLEPNHDEVRTGTRGALPRVLNYPFWVYLRHHGFPSPLLDWSLSPYVAAYFALHEKVTAERAAVFAYIEHPRLGKVGGCRQPLISTFTNEVAAHPRHFLQQCRYSIATKSIGTLMSFCPHSEIFNEEREDQDLLFKIELPRQERLEALRELQLFNISHYNLFQGEDALVRQLAMECFDLEDL